MFAVISREFHETVPGSPGDGWLNTHLPQEGVKESLSCCACMWLLLYLFSCILAHEFSHPFNSLPHPTAREQASGLLLAGVKPQEAHTQAAQGRAPPQGQALCISPSLAVCFLCWCNCPILATFNLHSISIDFQGNINGNLLHTLTTHPQ